ncbi:MAG: amidase domain-containing protein [Clostridiales bacterium]|jgi:hypothetical protein|nr:amidase domain-containing protein [Clostridiales bacterium]
MIYDRYNRKKAIEYAHTWALRRNPEYYNFDGLGGDCTNFISQCIYAGCGIMNYKRDIGWYYNSQYDRSAAWTSVEHLHRFLTTNTSNGPYATEIPLEYAEPGDIIQLSYNGKIFGHSLFIVEVEPKILVAQHSSLNFDNRAFDTYLYQTSRLLHIEGVISF